MQSHSWKKLRYGLELDCEVMSLKQDEYYFSLSA